MFKHLISLNTVDGTELYNPAFSVNMGTLVSNVKYR